MGNDERKVYISYAWGGESERIAKEIDSTLQASGITIIRDKPNLGYKGRIRNFMEQIGRGHAVVVIVSDKYIKSPNCMYELVEIEKNKDLYDRIFPIVLEDADIYDPVNRIKYIKHWEENFDALDKGMKSISSANQQGLREEIDSYDEIRDNISNLLFLLKDMNTLTKKIHEDSGFASLISAIKERLEKIDEGTTDSVPAKTEPTEDFVETALRKLGHPAKVYHRADLEDKLWGSILGDEHLVTFIHGLPGSGKTILLGETVVKIRETSPNIFLFKFTGVFAKEHAYFIEELNDHLGRLDAGMDAGMLTNQNWRRSMEALSTRLAHIQQSILILDSVDQAPEGLVASLLDLLPQTKMVMTAYSRMIDGNKAQFVNIPPFQDWEAKEFLELFGGSSNKMDGSFDWLKRLPKKIQENPQRLALLIAYLRDVPLELLLEDGLDELAEHPSSLTQNMIQGLSNETMRVLSLIVLLQGVDLSASLKKLKIAPPKDLIKALSELLGKSLIYRQGDGYLIPSLVRESAVEAMPKAINDQTVEQVGQAIQTGAVAFQDQYDQSSALLASIMANFFLHLSELDYNNQILSLATDELIEAINRQGFWKEYQLILRIVYEAAKTNSNLPVLAAIGFRIVRKSFQIRDMPASRQTLIELEHFLETNPDPRIAAELLSHQALFTELDGNSQGALDQLQKSFQIHKDLGNKESMATIKNLMGNIHLRQKDITQARQSYKEALPQDPGKLTPSKHTLEVETNIAVCDFIEGKLDEAQAKLNDTIEKCNEAGFLAGLPRSYYILAQVLNKKRQYGEALRFAELAAESAKNSGQSIVASAEMLIWKLKRQNLQDPEDQNHA